MSSVWMWHFHEPSPPTMTIESPRPAQASLNALVGARRALEQEHDLVVQVGDGAALPAGGAVAGDQLGHGMEEGRRQHRLGARDVLAQGVEEEQQAGAAGVDHPGGLEHRQQLGGLEQRLARRGRRPDPAATAQAVADAAAPWPLRRRGAAR